MTTITTICLAVLVTAGLLVLLRLARGGSVANRIVALDMLLLVSASGIAIGTVRTGSSAFVDALVIAALLGFVGTVTVARFIERRNP